MYLHSLWHRGPPRSQNPIPNPYFLRPTTFVRRGYLPPVKRSRIQREYSDPGIDWSCKIRKDTRRATAPGWPSVSIQSSSQPRSLTPKEQARMDSIQAQKAALKAVSDFLSCRYNADGEGNEDECIDEFEEGDMDDTTEGEGCRNFDFFEKLYETDSALRVMMHYLIRPPLKSTDHTMRHPFSSHFFMFLTDRNQVVSQRHWFCFPSVRVARIPVR
ncbi:unnamed protein product [Cuscuta campestris]|uniref:Uncharacterized protein n=1 Tax=Cuscuta campestris TaxID=132261 RepID=A0A484NBA8_9ASTE|nr:unnamed protein product [Cuscuta campestris]